MYQNSVQHRIERADEYEVFFFPANLFSNMSAALRKAPVKMI